MMIINIIAGVINWVGGFIINRAREFADIYVDERQIKESFGDEYAERFAAINPATGKKQISAAKLLKRVVITGIVAFWIVILIRYKTTF